MSPADLVTVAIVGILAAAIIAWRGRLRGLLMRLAGSMPWSMAVLAMLPVALRLALLARFPAPDPAVSDDFSYVLLADTLRRLRLANPVHPMHAFLKRSSCCRSRVIVPFFRSARARRSPSAGPCSVIHGLACCCLSPRCRRGVTGCCGGGRRRDGHLSAASLRRFSSVRSVSGRIVTGEAAFRL